MQSLNTKRIQSSNYKTPSTIKQFIALLLKHLENLASTMLFNPWTGGRVAEGAPLLREWGGNSSVGSNPILSAIILYKNLNLNLGTVHKSPNRGLRFK